MYLKKSGYKFKRHNDALFQEVLLGKWCNSEITKNAFGGYILPYHWNNRHKLYEDFVFLREYSDFLLCELVKALNKYHNVRYTHRFWEIVIGPWIGYFLQICFDRWLSLDNAIKSGNISATHILCVNSTALAPQSTSQLIDSISNHLFNESLYSHMLEFMAPSWSLIYDSYSLPSSIYSSTRIQKFSFKRLILYTCRYIFSVVTFAIRRRKTYHCFANTYFSGPLKKTLFKRVSAFSYLSLVSSPQKNVTQEFRSQHLSYPQSSGLPKQFLEYISNNLLKFLPVSFLESFSANTRLAKLFYFPLKPASIIDSNLFIHDDFFKVWAASLVEKYDTKLIIGQHGGNFGTSMFNFIEDHQLSVSDFFLSWGWNYHHDVKAKIVPVGNFKLYNKHFVHTPEDTALLVQGILPPYSSHLFSSPIAAHQVHSYLQDQVQFFSTLSSDIQAKFSIRIDRNDYNYNQSKMWKENFPGCSIDYGTFPIISQAQKSKLFVVSYNATTILESLALNVPTIMYWNESHWELNDYARPLFNQLKKVSVFHPTPESAACFINQIWDDVDSWWSCKDVQLAKDMFCSYFSDLKSDQAKSIVALLQAITSPPNTCYSSAKINK